MTTDNFYSQIMAEYVEPETKDNHFIPQFLLRNFCKNPVSESIYLNTLTNKKSHAKIKNNKIKFKNKFSKQVIFNDSLEKYFGTLETIAAPLIKRMHDFSRIKLKYNLLDLNAECIINSHITDMDYFKFTNKEKEALSNLYISIFIRILMNSTMKNTNLMQSATLLNEVSNNVFKQLFSNNIEDNIKTLNSLNNFKNTLLNIQPEHLIQSFNDFYYYNSKAKNQVLNYLYNAFLTNKVVLISWDCAILPIANSLPFSWQNKVMYLPVSANSILYVDNSINCLNMNYIKNNTFHILSEYRTYIHQNAYEFFYYDKSMAELRQDYHNFKY